MRPIQKIRRGLIYRLVVFLRWLFNIAPRRMAIFVGGWIGLTAWHILRRDQHKAEKHLRLVFGDDLTYRQRLGLGRRFFINSGRNVADLLRFERHYETELKALISVEGFEHFEKAYADGRGLIGITGHIGNFELMAAYVSSLGYDIAVIGRELADSRLNDILMAHRRTAGLVNIATTDSPRKALTWLKEGKALGVLIDTDSHRIRGEFVPAFGRWSYTPIGQSLLGLKTGAAFVPLACVRTPEDRYRLIVKPPIEFKPTGDTETDAVALTGLCTAALEEIIRTYPDQWPWMHNRWRTRRETA